MASKLMEKLFNRWKTSYTYAGVKFYQRIVSAAVIEDARRHSTMESRVLRQKLRNPNTEEHKVYIAYLNDEPLDVLKTAMVNAVLLEAAQRYVQQNPKPSVPEPGEGLEEQENYMRAVEERDALYQENLSHYLEQTRESYEKRLETMSEEDIRNEAKRFEIDRICEQRFVRAFENYVVAASLFEDPEMKHAAFTLEDFENLPDEARDFFVSQYNNINLTEEEVKN